MDDFELQIREWVERAKIRMDTACRMIAIELHTRIVMKSPVGNPELWAANAEVVRQRAEHNVVVDQITAYLKSDPRNLTARGNLKRKVRSKFNKRLSRSELAKMYELKAGKGYVGGRLRGSWQASIGAPSTSEPSRIDPSGGDTIAAAAAALASFQAGPSIYLTSNVPYASRIEYGWSKQAPNGMVRVSVAEVSDIVRDVVARLPNE